MKPAVRDRFVLGAQYYRAPTPLPDEWEDDLARMGGAGIDTIQLRLQWRWHELRCGQYNFEDSDRLFSLAEKHGKAVIVKFMLETAPEYAFTELDGARRDMHGNPIRPGGNGAYYVGGWWPCFENPQVMDRALRFVSLVVERYKNKESLLLWNIWNEPRMRPIDDCACEHSLERYRSWLERRFGTVKAMNERYGKAWDSFDSIGVPGMPYDYVELYLWRQWAHEALSRRLKTVYDTVKSHDDTRPIISHVGTPMVRQDIAGDVSDDVLNAENVDFYGMSYSTANRFMNCIDEATPFLVCDWMRNVSPYFWVYELYPDWGKWNPPARLYDFNLRVWSALACGTKGILYWQYRAERVGSEEDLAGLVHIDGTFKDITHESGRIAEFIHKHESFFMNAKVAEDGIGILYDRESDLINRIETTGTPGKWNDFSLKGGYPYHYKKALMGTYALFRELGVTCRMIDTRSLERFLDGIRLLYIPQGFMLTEDAFRVLREYTENGGRIIAEEGLGLRDERTWVRPQWPAMPMQQLFGAKIFERVSTEYVCEYLDVLGVRVPASGYVSRLHALDEREISGHWEDGSGGIVSSVSTAFLGTSLGASFYENHSDRHSYCKALRRLCGILQLDLPDELPEGVYRRSLETGEKRLVFYFNSTEFELHLPKGFIGGRVCWGAEKKVNGELYIAPRSVLVVEMPAT
jgi:beta-galactosidase